MGISLSKGVGVSPSGTIALESWDYSPYIVIGGQTGAAATITYSQTGTTVTVTHTGHLMTADMNGGQIYLTQSTGSLLSGWFTNWTYVDANTYTCTSTVSQSTSGNLGTNTAETVTPFAYTVPSTAIGNLVAMAMTHLCAGLTTGTKTLKTYFDSAVVASSSVTVASTYFVISAAATQTFISNTKYFTTGLTLPLTLTTPNYGVSLQVSDAKSWFAVSPSYLTYSDRR